MFIGVPKETKDEEYRVAITPDGTRALCQAGHQVLLQATAGEGSGFTDEEYRDAGASIVAEPGEVFRQAEIVVKVKEPLPPEYELLREGLILFTFLHLAAEKELTQTLIDKRVTAIAYETVEQPDGSLTLLTPMSAIAGRLAVQIGAHYLEKVSGGCGKLLGGVPGVPPCTVAIIGGGCVGRNAAEVALGMGARIIILDVNAARLQELMELFGGHVETLMSNPSNIAMAVKQADLLIGSILIPGAAAPHLVTREMVSSMRHGSVIADVAIDQGGCIETSHPTLHSDPVYSVDGVIHYCAANMPGAVPRTSTLALTNATLPYILKLANLGFRQAALSDSALAKGVNVYDGHITNQGVARAFGLDYTPLSQLLD